MKFQNYSFIALSFLLYLIILFMLPGCGTQNAARKASTSLKSNPSQTPSTFKSQSSTSTSRSEPSSSALDKQCEAIFKAHPEFPELIAPKDSRIMLVDKTKNLNIIPCQQHLLEIYKYDSPDKIYNYLSESTMNTPKMIQKYKELSKQTSDSVVLNKITEDIFNNFNKIYLTSFQFLEKFPKDPNAINVKGVLALSKLDETMFQIANFRSNFSSKKYDDDINYTEYQLQQIVKSPELANFKKRLIRYKLIIIHELWAEQKNNFSNEFKLEIETFIKDYPNDQGSTNLYDYLRKNWNRFPH